MLVLVYILENGMNSSMLRYNEVAKRPASKSLNSYERNSDL